MTFLKFLPLVLLIPLQLMAQFQFDTELLRVQSYNFDIKAVLDLDQDGYLDIISSSGWHPGIAHGEFGDFREAWDQSYVFSQLFPGDFDQDGDIDLIGKIDQFNEVLLNNNGSEYFNISLMNDLGIQDVMDIDEDGDLDALYQDQDMIWYVQNDQGAFSDSLPLINISSADITSFRLEDMDNDMDLDLLVFHSNADFFCSIFENDEGVFTHKLELERDDENPLVDYWNYLSVKPINTGDENPGLYFYGTSTENGLVISHRSSIGDWQYSEPELLVLEEALGCFYSYQSVNANVLNLLGDERDEILNITDSDMRIWTYDSQEGYQLLDSLAYNVDCSLISIFQLDDDPLMEVVTYDHWSASTSTLNFSESGEYEEKVIYQQFCGYISNVRMHDYDLDGDLDILFHCENSGLALVENQNGSFAESRGLTNVSRTTGSLIADTNNDGIDEYYLIGYEGIHRYEKDLEGNLQIVDHISANSTAGRVIHATDLNGDGLLDLLTADSFKLQASMNQGDGSFSAHEDIFIDVSSQTHPRHVAMADWDQDGDEDFVYSSQLHLYWKENLGAGAFAAIAEIGNIDDIRFSLIDLDGDGDLDVINHPDCSSDFNTCSLRLQLWQDNDLVDHQVFNDVQMSYYGNNSLCQYTNPESSYTDLLLHGLQLINDGVGNYSIEVFEEAGFNYVKTGTIGSQGEEILAYDFNSIRLLSNDQPSSIEPLDQSLSLYPNPAKDFLILAKPDVSDYHLYIYSNDGRLVIEQAKASRRIDLTGLPDGRYFVQLQREKSNLRSSFVICR